MIPGDSRRASSYYTRLHLTTRSLPLFFPIIFTMATFLTTWLTYTLLLSLSYSSPVWSHSPSLADLALQKVLSDSSQIFGVPSHYNTTTATTYSTWMRRLPDSTLLTSINIPGTHESATWNFSRSTRDSLPTNTNPANNVFDAAYYRCQSRSIFDALNAGIRFFDLRYALDPTFTRLVFWHNAALMSGITTVEDVLFSFYAWLDAHPSETVILSFQYEGSTQPGASNDITVQTLLFQTLTSSAARRYISQTKDQLPTTLGEARGKIILFRRFDSVYDDHLPGLHLSPGQWPDNGKDFALVYNTPRNLTAYVEDYYEPDDLVNQNASTNIAAKLAAVQSHLGKATGGGGQGYEDGLFITFASAEHNVNDPPVTPETMAVGNTTLHAPQGVNQQLVPMLRGMKGQRVGIIVLDFWEQPDDLVPVILSL
ncbi:PLC-like phosphodiesterase [Diplogelasinospora grovesii]|uniref:PLC-like phosphodiesterase n=1 Tax=Diplogelasinospora grovesii TaxID=303347 RepID=A0AAN6N816_9PEZI|nr:PLC-like phosphodiesterase [Diplogelasinospora grovesii]